MIANETTIQQRKHITSYKKKQVHLHNSTECLEIPLINGL